MTADQGFQVLWSQKARDALRAMRDQTHDSELRFALLKVIKHLDERLRQDPLQLGEVYRQKGNVVKHLAAYQLLAIDFAVDIQLKIVLVQDARPLSSLNL